MGRTLKQERSCKSLAGLIAIRHDPNAACGLHHRNNEGSLSLRTVGPHGCNDVSQSVLMEPPYRCEAFNDNQIINRKRNSRTIVEKVRLPKLENLTVSFTFRGETVSRIFFIDCRIIHYSASIA